MNDPEKLVRRFFDEAINDPDLALFDELCVTDYIRHGGSDAGAAGDVHGFGGFKAAVATFFTAFHDVEAAILDTVATEDKVAVRFVERGTPQGTFEATGQPVEFYGIGIYRVEDGTLAEEWFIADSRAILEQIGAIPALRATSTWQGAAAGESDEHPRLRQERGDTRRRDRLHRRPPRRRLPRRWPERMRCGRARRSAPAARGMRRRLRRCLRRDRAWRDLQKLYSGARDAR